LPIASLYKPLHFLDGVLSTLESRGHLAGIVRKRGYEYPITHQAMELKVNVSFGVERWEKPRSYILKLFGKPIEAQFKLTEEVKALPDHLRVGEHLREIAVPPMRKLNMWCNGFEGRIEPGELVILPFHREICRGAKKPLGQFGVVGQRGA
jgi:hypothetical protein